MCLGPHRPVVWERDCDLSQYIAIGHKKSLMLFLQQKMFDGCSLRSFSTYLKPHLTMPLTDSITRETIVNNGSMNIQ